MRRAAVLILAGLLIALVAACGDDDDDDAAGDADAPAAADASDGDGGDDEGGDGDDTAHDGDGDGDGDDSAADDGADIAGLLQRFQEREFRVTYDLTATTAGQEFVGRMTWYRALDGRARFDFDVTQAGQAFEVITIVTEETSYFCSGLLGANSCFEFSDESPLPLPDLSGTIVSQVEDLGSLRGFGSVTRETIGGVEGRCVDVDEAGVDGEICVSDEGLLLRSDVLSPDGAVRIEIVDFDFEVPDSAFDSPYPVSSFPGAP